MQFPNQDKTIFDTFSGKGEAPAKVERVLPTPEEPIDESAATPDESSETSTWVNDKLHPKTTEPERVIGGDDTQEAPKTPPMKAVETARQQAKAAMNEASDAASAVATTEPEDKAAAYAQPPIKVTPKAEPKVAPKSEEATPVATGGVQVQLGAYRSEAEAQKAWGAIEKKFALADMDANVVQADLGERGVYYRLRAGAFVTAAQAKAFCSKLTAKGQACLLPTGK